MVDEAGPEAEGEAVADPLALARVLKGTPPVPLIKDDEPNDGKEPPDRFGTSEVAKRLSDIVEKIEPPYTVSLSGPWGVGKTWVTKRLPALLMGKVPVIEVDLWSEDLPELRRTLAVQVAVWLSPPTTDPIAKRLEDKAAELDKELRRPVMEPAPPRTLAPDFKTWRGILPVLIALGLGFLVWVAISQPPPEPGVAALPWVAPLASVCFGGLIWLLLQSGMVLSVAQPNSTLPPIREAVALRNTFIKFVSSSERKVLIVLDNLDRLAGADAVQVLGEVRSFVELRKSRCIFLIPLDRGALERHLVHTMGGEEQAARDYLDKFFNLDLVLTNPTAADLRSSILGLLSELFPGCDEPTLAPVAEMVATAANGSPRTAKRIVNGIYARSYLVPDQERARVTLLDVAFVESLIARFPRTVAHLNKDPERAMRRISEIRRLTDGLERVGHLMALVGERVVVPAEEPRKNAWIQEHQAALQELLDFVRFTPSIAPGAAVIRTVLTGRPNRQLGLVSDPDAAERALKEGDYGALAATLGALEGVDLHKTLVALLDVVRVDLAAPWRGGARAGMNALAPAAVADTSAIDMVRREAADYLVAGDEDDFRSLSQATIDALYPGGARGTHRGRAVAERAVETITAKSALPASGVVRFVVATADALGQAKLNEARGGLAKLEDMDVAPIFESDRGAGLMNFGPICELYATRLVAFEPDADPGPSELAAERLLYAQEHGHWDGTAALEPVFDRLVVVLGTSSATAALMPLLEKVAQLASFLQANAHIDALAQALITWAPGGLRARELALELSTTPAAIAPAMTALLTGMVAADFMSIGESHRSKLDAAGVDVAGLAVARWAAAQGNEYLDIAITADDPSQFDRVFSALKGVVDPENYLAALRGVAGRVNAFASGAAATQLIADAASRALTLPVSVVGRLAAIVASLQAYSDPAPVVAAASALVSGSSRAEIPLVTALTKAFVDAGVTGAESLPPVLAEHCAGQGAIDLDHVGWLWDQPGVPADTVLTAVSEAIKTEAASRTISALDGLSATRRKRWGIGKSLVERAGMEVPGDRRVWLEAAKLSRTPSHATERRAYEEYRVALDRAADQDSSVDDVVAELRQRLG